MSIGSFRWRAVTLPSLPRLATATLIASALAASVLAIRPVAAQDLPDGYVKDPPVTRGLAPGMAVEATDSVTRAYQIRFSSGDEILSGLTDLAITENISSAQITGLGGLASALLSFGDPSIGERVFKLLPIDDKGELVSLVGTVSLRDGVPSVHLHAVIALADGSTRGGHVLALEVAPVAEVTLLVTAAQD